MTSLFYTLYPRTSASFASSTLAGAPGAVAPSTEVFFPFSTGKDGAGTLITSVDQQPVVIELRLLWQDAAGLTPITANDVLAAAGMGLPPLIQIAIAPHTPIGGGAIPKYPNTSQLNASISTNADGAVQRTGLQTVTGAPAIGNQAVMVQGDRVRIWLTPANRWDDTAAGANGFPFRLYLKNNDATRSLRAVFAAAFTADSATDIAAEVEQKWLNVQRNATLSADATSVNVSVVNFGTGPAGGAGRLTGVSAPAVVAGGAVTVSPLAPTLEPGQSQTMTASVAAGLRGVLIGNTSITVTSNDVADGANTPGATDTDSEHNHVANLVLDQGAIELMMVFDASGSMLATFDGATRWQRLKTAVGVVHSAIEAYAEDKTTASLTIFPAYPDVGAIDSNDARVHVGFTGFTDFKPLAIDALNFVESRLTGSALTPISAGIDRALQALEAFEPAPPASTGRRMLLMSDGLWNRGIDPASATIIDRLVSDQVAPLAVRFLEGGAGDNRLETLVAGYTARPEAAGIGAGTYQHGSDFTDLLANAVAPMLGITVVDDPDGCVTSVRPVAYHEFTISAFDRSALFAIWWNTPEPRRLRVRLFSPLCADGEISADTVANFPGVSFNSGDAFRGSFQTFFFPEAFLKGASGTDRFGTWRLIVELVIDDGPVIEVRGVDPGLESEEYTYRIFSESALTFSAGLLSPLSSTGDAVAVTAQLRNAGGGVLDAAISVDITAPTASLNQFGARNFASAEALAAARRLAEQGLIDPDFWSIKLAALASLGKVFSPQLEQRTFAMSVAAARDGTYTTAPSGTPVAPPSARIPGTYAFRVVANGSGSPGFRYRRFVPFSVSVSAQLHAPATITTISFGAGGATGQVRVWPFDAFGNPILFDPAFEAPFSVAVSGGTLVGALTPLQDASYVQDATFDVSQRPVLSITPAGAPAPAISNTLPQVSRLIWADTLLRLILGGDVAPGNQHTNGQALLGPLNPDDDFVSLGAEGVVIVAVKHACAPKEVAVFVRLENDLRPYTVEINRCGNLHAALNNPEAGPWVLLGRSEGVTASFPVSGITGVVPVVRITDVSGQEVSSDGSTATPGVSLLAMGFGADNLQPAPRISVDDVAICATQSIELKQGVSVLEEDGSSAAISNAGKGSAEREDGVRYATSIADGALVGDTFSVGNVLGDGMLQGTPARFDGNVFTSGKLTLKNGAKVTEGHFVQQRIPLQLPDLRAFVRTFPLVGKQDIEVDRGETRTLFPNPPRGYEDVRVKSGGTLILSAPSDGQDPLFFFEKLKIHEGGVLDIRGVSGVVEIQVRGEVEFGGTVKVKTGRANLLIVSSTTDEFAISAPFIGTAVAPSGKLHLHGRGEGQVHLGCFHGREVVVDSGWTIKRKRRS